MMKNSLRLYPIPGLLSVCQVPSVTSLPLDAPMYFVGRTEEEISLVCPVEHVPADTTAREDGWRGFRIGGTLDFSLIGILADITAVLKAEDISVFCLSTYNTDYVLTKADRFDEALRALARAGYAVEENE